MVILGFRNLNLSSKQIIWKYEKHLTHIQFLSFLGLCINSFQVPHIFLWVLTVHWRMARDHLMCHSSFLNHILNTVFLKKRQINTANFVLYIFDHNLFKEWLKKEQNNATELTCLTLVRKKQPTFLVFNFPHFPKSQIF